MKSLTQLHPDLPSSSDESSDVWYVRGVWAEHLERPATATQCFEKALFLDDCFPEAMFRLAAAVDDSFSTDVVNQFTARISSIERYREVCKTIFFKGPERRLVSEAVELSDPLGRLYESAAWCGMLNQGLDVTSAVQERLRELENKIAIRGERNSRRHWSVLDEMQLQKTEFPPWPLPQSSDDAAESRVLAAHFEDVASGRGLNFKYENGAIEQSGLMIQQSMGGGVAVLDYDRDAWPDVFFRQGRAHVGNVHDALFRNLSGESFASKGEFAQCGSDDYSHGASVGDVDDDGFPDLYVAISGRNRLYLNNGDGTFSSVDGQFSSERWSISCVIADLTGDSFPDRFDVNYLEWGRPFTEQCTDTELGLPRTCPPDRFEGELNDLYLNSGEGDFRMVTEEVGLGMLMGKGLGVVVADFEDSGNVGVFIANDEVPNTYLTRRPLQNDHPVEGVRFVNKAGSSGLAFDGMGAALACMGVATSDVNNDGYLDLFVTNFYRQPNTLYLLVDPAVVEHLHGYYREIRDDLGLKKTPGEYGALPCDPYSHTPRHAGAQQPGMTGQVKEDILCRWAEVGVRITNGKLHFSPALFECEEVLENDSIFAFYDLTGTLLELLIEKGDFAFTLCQIPVIYHCGEERKLVIGYATSEAVVRQRLTLTDDESTSVFSRRGEINRIDVYFAASSFG